MVGGEPLTDDGSADSVRFRQQMRVL